MAGKELYKRYDKENNKRDGICLDMTRFDPTTPSGFEEKECDKSASSKENEFPNVCTQVIKTMFKNESIAYRLNSLGATEESLLKEGKKRWFSLKKQADKNKFISDCESKLREAEKLIPNTINRSSKSESLYQDTPLKDHTNY